MCLYRVKVKKTHRNKYFDQKNLKCGYSEGVYPNSKIKTYTGKMIRTLGETVFQGAWYC